MRIQIWGAWWSWKWTYTPTLPSLPSHCWTCLSTHAARLDSPTPHTGLLIPASMHSSLTCRNDLCNPTIWLPLPCLWTVSALKSPCQWLVPQYLPMQPMSIDYKFQAVRIWVVYTCQSAITKGSGFQRKSNLLNNLVGFTVKFPHLYSP